MDVSARRDDKRAQFLDVFRRSNKFSEVQAVCRSLGDSPLVGLFQAGYAELTAQLRQAAPDAATGPNPRPAAGRPTLKSLAGGRSRADARVGGRGQQAREATSPFLATTASIAPFIGLFGTVWGIMSAFEQHRRRPARPTCGGRRAGIAEALIATAAGLVGGDSRRCCFYNHLSQRVKLFASEMDDFAMEFLNIAERNFT